MATDKYDLHTVDYSVQGWDAIMSSDMEQIDDAMNDRMIITLGETIAAKKAVYLNSDGKYYQALADQVKQPVLCLTIESGVLDDEVRGQRVGSITDTGWSWTIGSPVFLSSTTAGELTQTAPTTKPQLIGFPTTATTVFLTGTIDLDALAT